MIKKFILLVFLMLSVPFGIMADAPANNGGGKPNPVVIVPKKEVVRPQKPSSQFIDCMYCDGSLYISFRNPEGMCELTVTTDDDVATYMFDTSTSAEIFIGEHPAAHLLLTTEYGHSYQGDI